MVGTNTKGLRALEAYRHRTNFGGPGQRQCVARSRRTGEKCRAVPMRHKNVCRHHGGHSNGRGVKKPMENRNLCQQNNRAIRHARFEAKRDLDARDFHPETMQVFRQQYAGAVECVAPIIVDPIARVAVAVGSNYWTQLTPFQT